MTKTERLIREIKRMIQSIEDHWIESRGSEKLTPVDRAAVDEHLALCIEEMRRLRLKLAEGEG